MTATLEAPVDTPAWGSMPGWTIVGDLTPPELIEARRLHTLRRLVALGLGLVVVLCVLGYGYALVQHSRATDDLDNASSQTAQLQLETNKYSGITRIETTVAGVNGQVASAMADDVDTAALVAKLRAALPGSMSISNLTITINSATSASAAGVASSLDVSGHPIIGSVTITGNGQQLSDVSSYVDSLSQIPGLTNVVPTSNAMQNGTSMFTVMLSVTDQLYSNHFTVKGAK